jgi:hydroxymethylbilane synthase
LHNQKTYKIGTRGSLLALTQCNQVKDELEKITGDKFELDVIKTQGDLITNAPLWQLDGKDFFTKELDDALISGRVDLVVHSYKDLGSIRPEPITLAAVTKRTYAHDILLIKNSSIPKIKEMKEFIVGTSSPRRMVNLEKKLNHYLPNGAHLKITPKVLRGNVNTRISKLVDNEYDAIVLALPGIERLALTESSRIELTKLLKDMNFMVLPQSIFPSSASQGALGIECLKVRSDNGELFNKLKKMEDQNTLEEVSRERKAFNEYGGGCHLAVGVNVRKFENFYIHTHRGLLNNKDVFFSELEGRELPQFFTTPKTFIGLPKKDDKLITKVAIKRNLDSNAHYFVSSKYSIESLKKEEKYGSLWSAGTKTMRDLCDQGFWVNGSADSLGINEAIHLKNSQAISIMINASSPLINLTHEDGINSLKTYERKINSVNSEYISQLQNTELFYWTSFSQYETFVENFPFIKNKLHATGLGKTYQQFKTNNIAVFPFHSMESFEKFVNIN